jgi:transcriptional regulator with XRE-family HTH domain
MKSIHDPRYAQLIQRLVTLREKVETTQTELAERLRKPQSYVAKVENLDRRLDVVEIANWLTALQTSPQRFMAELEWWH